MKTVFIFFIILGMCPAAKASEGIRRRTVLLGGIAVVAASTLPRSESLPLANPQTIEPSAKTPTFAEWRETFWSNSLKVREAAVKSLQESVTTGVRTFTVGKYSTTAPDIDESAIQALVNQYAKALTIVESELIHETQAPMLSVTDTFERSMLHDNHYQPNLHQWDQAFFDHAVEKLKPINESFAWTIRNGAYKQSDNIREMLQHPLLESSSWKIPHECLFRAFWDQSTLSDIFERLNPERVAKVRKQYQDDQGPGLMNCVSSYIPSEEMLAFKIRVSQQLDALIPSLAKQLNVSEIQVVEELRYLMSPYMDLPWNRHYRPRFAVPLNTNEREAIVTAIEGVHLELAAYIRSFLENHELLVGRTLNWRYAFSPETINRWQLEALVNDLQTRFPDTPHDHFIWQLINLARLRMGLDDSSNNGNVGTQKTWVPQQPEVLARTPSRPFEGLKSAFRSRPVFTNLFRMAVAVRSQQREKERKKEDFNFAIEMNDCSDILAAPGEKNVDPPLLTTETPLLLQLQTAPLEAVAAPE